MDKLFIFIEISGMENYVGEIEKTTPSEGRFRYAEEYLALPDAAPISCSLPLREEPYSEQETRNFFDGLLPEGFTRRTVAGWIHADANDYLAILAGLGKECLGAIQILDSKEATRSGSYEPLTRTQVKELAREGTVKSAEIVTKTRLSLTGASGKAGLYYQKEKDKWFLPIGDCPSTHIVKQSHVSLEGIVTNEQLALLAAAGCGLRTPDSFIINTGNAREEDVLFATERYDRTFEGSIFQYEGLPVPLRLHQEDFAQALGISASDKYEEPGMNYLQKCFALLRKVSSNPIEDQLRLWDTIMFDYLIGNTDNHIKNISLLYGENLKSVRFAPVYDILSTVVYESATRDMAICLGSENSLDRIDREAISGAAAQAGISEKIALGRLDSILSVFEKSLKEAAAELNEQGFFMAPGMCEKILSAGGYRNL